MRAHPAPYPTVVGGPAADLLGTAVAVLVDATVVRATLVPALVHLFGRWNWWAPVRLRRMRRRLGLELLEAPPGAG